MNKKSRRNLRNHANRFIFIGMIAVVIISALLLNGSRTSVIPAKEAPNSESITIDSVALHSAFLPYLGHYLSATVVVNSSVPLVKLEAIVNGTEVAVRNYSDSAEPSAHVYSIWYKAVFHNELFEVVPNQEYNITFIATFSDNGQSIAATNVNAQ